MIPSPTILSTERLAQGPIPPLFSLLAHHALSCMHLYPSIWSSVPCSGTCRSTEFEKRSSDFGASRTLDQRQGSTHARGLDFDHAAVVRTPWGTVIGTGGLRRSPFAPSSLTRGSTICQSLFAHPTPRISLYCENLSLHDESQGLTETSP